MQRVVIFFYLLVGGNVMYAQQGIVTTFAGCNSGCLSTTDGVAATTSLFANTSGVGIDAAGNMYIADFGRHVVRKVDVNTGLIYTVAGTGTAGFSGDGGAATSAKLNSPRGIFVDSAGNIYISDANQRIRKVTASTGIITTVAGGGSSTIDGVLATSENISEQLTVFVDHAGNIYCSGINSVKKVNATTGIITTVAGGGSSSADSIPATSAMIPYGIKCIVVDGGGNIYIISHDGDKVRRVDATTGIIKTYAGGGSSMADGVLATDASLSDIHSCYLDGAGNLYIADRGHGLIRKVSASTGLIYTIAGGGSSSDEGIDALTASVGNYQITLDAIGNIYYSEYGKRARKITYAPTCVADSFSVYVNKFCSGPKISVYTKSYTTGMTVKTWFGDNVVSTNPVISGYVGGYTTFTHNYPVSGNYTIKHVLYRGSTKLDSISYKYEYVLCNAFPVKYYYDANNNCKKDSSENFLTLPINIEIDSNGKKIDDMSTTSGIYYTAYGKSGDVYSFKITKLPGNLLASCPASGIVSDTLDGSSYNHVTKYVGLQCSSGSSFDLAVHADIPVTGIHDQWGNIYVSNSYCNPISGTLTLHYSPKYVYKGGASPAPTSASGNTITWNLSSLSSAGTTQTKIWYAIWEPSSGPLSIRDTVNSYFVVNPLGGDVDTNNNVTHEIDTVRGSCDPNEMWVSPEGYITTGTQLRYRIDFENVGNDTAHNIYVMDTLSNYLDVASMNIIMSSHTMNISKYQDTFKNTILRFDFPTINLLDSSFHDKCTGTVIFTIKTKTGLVDGTKILNHAGIFFDDNGVVTTNLVENIIGNPNNVENIYDENEVRLYPNPAKNSIAVSMMHMGNIKRIQIVNIVGQYVYVGSFNADNAQIDISNLQSGVYFIKVNGAYMQKFLKE